jgi:apolipoprotein D and lipocalin family protein
MQFIWPFKGDYRIIFLDDDYSTTIIGRDKRDYVWLMARNPELPFDQYEKAVKFIVDAGYDRSQLQRVPQRW